MPELVRRYAVSVKSERMLWKTKRYNVMKYDFKLSAFADEAGALFTTQIEAMKNNGVHYLEMRGVNGRNVSSMTKDEIRCASIMLEREGLEVWSIGSPIGKIKITDDFAPHLDSFKRILEAAEIAKARCIRLFSFYDVKTAQQQDEAIERLSKMVEAAKGSSVVLCHENEKGIYGENTENCLRILKELPQLKAVFDPANFIQCGVDTKTAWDALAPYVYYLHIKDAQADGHVVPAGKGIGNLPYIVNDFGARGGSVLSLEPHLTIFKGFAELEQTNESINTEDFRYPDSMTAFKASADALKDIINN